MDAIEDVKDSITKTKDKFRKTISQKFWTILKYIVVIAIIGVCASNIFINYSENRLRLYDTQIEEKERVLDSLYNDIETSKEKQLVLDSEIKNSKQKSIQYENKINELIKEYESIREKVNRNSVDDAYDVVKQHLDSIRTRREKEVK